MRICVVIQSDAFRSSAGARIRYDRFRDSLGGSGVTIEMIAYRDLIAARSLDHDAYVFCKTFETPALLLARRVRAAGKIVGQDLFDDYFSQVSDVRLARYRRWMRDMAPVTHFAICSTRRMIEVVRPYLPDVEIVAIEDPVAGFDLRNVVDLAEAKCQQATSSRQLDLVWFGIGDNPFFPVGLADLANCEPEIARMARLGWTMTLKVVTNRRPFDAAGGEILRRLSVGYEVVEWTEELESEALSSATIAIVPVNGQSFSRAKSLNRAVTALSHGCQVLALGYPLYDSLSDFIYGSTEELLHDLEARTPKVRRDTVDSLALRLSHLADPASAASSFVEVARTAQARFAHADRTDKLTCMIHGRGSSIDVHKSVSAMGGLSVATIFSKAQWNFPVRFDRLGREIVMRVTPQLAERFQLPLREASKPKRILDFEFVAVDHAALGIGQFFLDLPEDSKPIVELVIYEDVIRFVEDSCKAAFGCADVLLSESSPISLPPFQRCDRAASIQAIAGQSHAASSTADLVSDGKWRPLSGLSAIVARKRKKAAPTKTIALLAESEFFDAQWYLKRYPDVADSGLDPARHYLEHGWLEGRNPGPGFSTRKYLKANRDVAERGVNPLLHYIEFGQWEGRRAHPVIKGATSP